MRSKCFRVAALMAMLLVVAPEMVPVFEAESAEAAPRRRPGRRVSRAQNNRARTARARQARRVQAQRGQAAGRARAQAAARARAQAASRARMTAMARLNQAQASAANVLAARLNNPANIPVVVYKDHQLQMGESHAVTTVSGKKLAFEDIAVGQTVTVTVVREKEDPKDPAKKVRSSVGQLTGKVTLVSANSAGQEMTLRVSSYQYGGKNGEVTAVAAGVDQVVSAVVVRSQAAGAGGLFKQ